VTDGRTDRQKHNYSELIGPLECFAVKNKQSMVHENALDLINDYSFYPIFLFPGVPMIRERIPVLPTDRPTPLISDH